MGVLAALLNTAIDALDEYGEKDENIREGYDFRCDSNTRSVDDITVRAGNSELVLAAIWKNLPGYKPSLPNMGEAFRNIGWSVIDTKTLEELKSENAELEMKLKALEGQTPWTDIKDKSEVIGKLTKAKELIEELIKSLFLAKGIIRDLIDETVDFKESKERAAYCYNKAEFDAYKKAEQFLKDCVVDK